METIEIVKDTPKGKDRIINLIPDENKDAVEYIEETYPETAKEFKRIQQEQY